MQRGRPVVGAALQVHLVVRVCQGLQAPAVGEVARVEKQVLQSRQFIKIALMFSAQYIYIHTACSSMKPLVYGAGLPDVADARRQAVVGTD